MGIFLRYGIPFLILAIALLITILLPEDKAIQIIAPLIVGVVMFSFRSFLGMPDVIIEGLGKSVTYQRRADSILLFVKGTLVNKSMTGIGELKSLILQIPIEFEEGKEYRYASHEEGQPRIMGFRFQPHGIFPSTILYFELFPAVHESYINNQPAEILLDVVGQSRKTYKVTISNK